MKQKYVTEVSDVADWFLWAPLCSMFSDVLIGLFVIVFQKAVELKFENTEIIE